MKSSHEKDTQILFYKVKSDVSSMLSRLLYEYTKQKEILENKHKEVLEYLNSSKKEDLLTLNLEQIHNKINQGYENKPYNIYISNKDYVIKNTTYKPDLGFNLSFAKKSLMNILKIIKLELVLLFLRNLLKISSLLVTLIYQKIKKVFYN